MLSGLSLLEIELNFFDLPLFVVEAALNFFHVDDSIDLSGGELAQPVLVARQDRLLIQRQFLPILRNVH